MGRLRPFAGSPMNDRRGWISAGPLLAEMQRNPTFRSRPGLTGGCQTALGDCQYEADIRVP